MVQVGWRLSRNQAGSLPRPTNQQAPQNIFCGDCWFGAMIASWHYQPLGLWFESDFPWLPPAILWGHGFGHSLAMANRGGSRGD